MKYKTKNTINICIIVVIFIVMTVYMLVVEGIDNIVHAIKIVDIRFALIGIVLIVAYWLAESLCLYIVEKKFYKRQKFFDSIKVSMIGQLFNCITPFSSGGQIVQAVAMKSEGKSVSKSASILLIKFVIYQATLVIYTLCVIIFQYMYFRNLVTNFVKLALIGFLVNFIVIIFLLLIGFNKKFVLKFLTIIYRFLGKIKIIKNIEEKQERLIKSVESFNNDFKIIRKEKIMVLKLFFITCAQLTIFYAITYVVYRMFGLNGESMFRIICAQAFLSMIMAFVPIPGAGIAAEGGFYMIFKAFFLQENINMAILSWRIYTFYLPIIVGAIFMIKMNKKENILEKVDSDE